MRNVKALLKLYWEDHPRVVAAWLRLLRRALDRLLPPLVFILSHDLQAKELEDSLLHVFFSGRHLSVVGLRYASRQDVESVQRARPSRCCCCSLR